MHRTQGSVSARCLTRLLPLPVPGSSKVLPGAGLQHVRQHAFCGGGHHEWRLNECWRHMVSGTLCTTSGTFPVEWMEWILSLTWDSLSSAGAPCPSQAHCSGGARASSGQGGRLLQAEPPGKDLLRAPESRTLCQGAPEHCCLQISFSDAHWSLGASLPMAYGQLLASSYLRV